MDNSPTTTWRIIAASVIGTSHQQIGKSCEDAHAFRYHNRSSLLLLVAADGAGTATYAAQGAQTAVQTAIDTAERILLNQHEPDQEDQWRSILTLIIQETHNRLASLVEEQRRNRQWAAEPANLTIREFATTLVLAIVTAQWIATVQIGDGAIVIHHQDQTIVSLTQPGQQEYINETSFLTDADYLFQAEYTILPNTTLRSIALLTDGLQQIAMHSTDNSPHQPFFKQMFDFVSRAESTQAELQRFLSSERVCARTDDDKTLVLAVLQ